MAYRENALSEFEHRGRWQHRPQGGRQMMIDNQPRLISDRRWRVCWLNSQRVKCSFLSTLELDEAQQLADEMNQSWTTLYHFVESVDGDQPGEFPGGPVATPPAA